METRMSDLKSSHEREWDRTDGRTLVLKQLVSY